MAKKEKKGIEIDIFGLDKSRNLLKNFVGNIEQITEQEKLRFTSGLKAKINEIDNFYTTLGEKAKGNTEQEKQITGEKQKALTAIVQKHVVSLMKFEADMAIKRMKAEKDTFLFKTDIRKEELEMLLTLKQEEIRRIESIDRENRTDEMVQQLEEAKIAQAEYNAELDRIPAQKLAEVLTGFKKIANQLSQSGGEIGKIFSGISGQMDNITTVFSKDQSVSSADKYTAGISSAITMINMVASANKQRKKAEDAYQRNALAFAHQYTLALNEQLRIQSEVSGSKFITDYHGKINDGFSAMSEASTKYNESLGKLSEGKAKTGLKNSTDWGNVAKGAAAGAVIGSVIPGIGTAIGTAVGAIGGALIGLFGGKKKKNKWGNLLDIAPGLIDESGELNKEMAEALLQTDQVDEKTKQLISDSLEWANAVEKAKEQLKDVVAELAGDLGNSLNSAMLGAWKNGGDASKAMFDTAGKSLENFIQNLLYSQLFADTFKDFEDRLVESLSPDGDNDILDDYDWLMDEMEKKNEDYIQKVESLQKRAGEKGFDLWAKDYGLTFDTLQKGLVDLTKQADFTFDQISKSFEGHMSEAITAMVKNKFLQKELENWYAQFKDAVKDGSLTEEETANLRAEYERIVREGNKMYTDAMKAAGLTILKDIGVTFETLQTGLKDLAKQTDLSFSSISKSFEGHMSEAILNMVKKKYLTDKLNEWYQKFNAAMDDDLLEKEETDALREEYQKIAQESNRWYNEAMKAAGLNMAGTREASASGIASMSQDSANELNGNFYALIYLVDDIHKILQRRYGIANLFNLEESNQNYMLPTMKDMLTVSRSSNTYLLDIRNNTSHLIAIDSNIGNINQNILALRNEGVKMRS